MRLHGSHTDAEAAGDLLVRAAARDLDQDIALARGETRDALAAILLDAFRAQGRREPRLRARDGGAEETSAVVQGAHRFAQFRGRRVLAQVSLRARADALEDVLLVVVNAEHENAGLGRRLPDARGGLEAGELRHRQV